MSGYRRAYSIAGVVLLAELASQFYLIAAAALHVWGADTTTGAGEGSLVFAGFKQGDTFAMLHSANGTIAVPLTILVMIGLAFGARHASRVKWLTAALFGLMVIQFVLAGLAFLGNAALSALAGLHGLNALAIVALSVYLVRECWAFRPEPLGRPPAAAVPQPTSGPAAGGL